jgi:hypothetical protein
MCLSGSDPARSAVLPPARPPARPSQIVIAFVAPPCPVEVGTPGYRETCGTACFQCRRGWRCVTGIRIRQQTHVHTHTHTHARAGAQHVNIASPPSQRNQRRGICSHAACSHAPAARPHAAQWRTGRDAAAAMSAERSMGCLLAPPIFHLQRLRRRPPRDTAASCSSAAPCVRRKPTKPDTRAHARAGPASATCRGGAAALTQRRRGTHTAAPRHSCGGAAALTRRRRGTHAAAPWHSRGGAVCDVCPWRLSSRAPVALAAVTGALHSGRLVRPSQARGSAAAARPPSTQGSVRRSELTHDRGAHGVLQGTHRRAACAGRS